MDTIQIEVPKSLIPKGYAVDQIVETHISSPQQPYKEVHILYRKLPAEVTCGADVAKDDGGPGLDMSMRDEFAESAMCKLAESFTEQWTAEEIAKHAYEIADAMIRTRKT